MTTYSRFADFLESGDFRASDDNLSFEQVCRKLHVSPFCLDEILMDELGMTGQEIMEVYSR